MPAALRVHARVFALALALVFALVFALALALTAAGCKARRPPWASDASPIRHPYRRSSFGPPRPPVIVPTIRIPPGETVACRVDADCAGHGRCFGASLVARYSPVFRDCDNGVAWRDVHEPGTCLHDECAGDGDCAATERCADLQMLPFPQRVCIPAPCRNDSDCRRARMGACVRYPNGTHCEHGGWSCAYPTDECLPGDPSRRCTSPRGMISYCVPRDGRFRCVTETPPEP